MGAIITLTTDFGLLDAYVAAMKGVILGINPEARLVDICHTVEPQNIHQAAFLLSTVYQFFPEKTVHLVVVDPGVGTERRAIILRTAAADFVAPDNGVLSYVLRDAGGWEAVSITNSRFWRSPVNPIFHGRDIFAPVAAWLSTGLAPVKFGDKITSLTLLPLSRPYQEADGLLVGRILHIDSFGNLITDIKDSDLPVARKEVTVEVGGRLIRGLSLTYAGGEGLLALIGSSGNLEIALKNGNAGALLKAKVGDQVRVKPKISGGRT